jgi:hypothetical protein
VKINIEIDLTPEEFQDLFVPSDKQQEFAIAIAQAYAQAAARVGEDIFNKTTEELMKLVRW